LKRIGFDDVYVHCYCDMPGTEASGLPAKVDRETMRRRLDGVRRAGIPHDAAETRREWESGGTS
jgi:tRNA A37 methylthiotransferase MiaB